MKYCIEIAKKIRKGLPISDSDIVSIFQKIGRENTRRTKLGTGHRAAQLEGPPLAELGIY